MQKLKLGSSGGDTSKGSGKKKRMGVEGAVVACENGVPHSPSLEHELSSSTGNFGWHAAGKSISMSTNAKAMVGRSCC